MLSCIGRQGFFNHVEAHLGDFGWQYVAYILANKFRWRQQWINIFAEWAYFVLRERVVRPKPASPSASKAAVPGSGATTP